MYKCIPDHDVNGRNTAKWLLIAEIQANSRPPRVYFSWASQRAKYAPKPSSLTQFPSKTLCQKQLAHGQTLLARYLKLTLVDASGHLPSDLGLLEFRSFWSDFIRYLLGRSMKTFFRHSRVTMISDSANKFSLCSRESEPHVVSPWLAERHSQKLCNYF